jgi:hypothetical protein
VFHSIRIRGTGGRVLWGYEEAAILRQWSIRPPPKRTPNARWTLCATFERVHRYRIRNGSLEHPLLFAAPRDGGLKGYWCWPIAPDSIQIGDTQMMATLGPPEGAAHRMRL